MSKPIAFFALLTLIAACSYAADVDYSKLKFEADIRPLMQKFCFECHGDVKPKGGIKFSNVMDLAGIQADPGKWEEVVKALQNIEMPPSTAFVQPSMDERKKIAGYVKWAVDNIDLSKIPKNPGRVIIRRLTRDEYNNTMRDLLGVDTKPADAFPADGGGGGGFDNNADTLFVPPLLMEKLLTAAKEVLDAAKPDVLFTAKPADNTPAKKKEAASKILTSFIRKAYRRPLKIGELDRYMLIFETYDKKNVPFEVCIKHAMKAVLCSPVFLFRIEYQPYTQEPGLLEHYEMASRLSYFIWSSMPDEELFKLAESKQLQDVKVLEAQVLRMLKDPKAVALGKTFANQWLGTDEIEKGLSAPDAKRFPQFTPELKDAMIGEVSTFFIEMLRNNDSMLTLIESDFTYANEELAKHYGIAGVSGKAFKRVTLPPGAGRGGVLGMAAPLTASSFALRTSPVLRGKFVLDKILGAPPPPPPPDTPTLPQDEPAQGQLSLREQLEKHRKDAKCAACHDRLDPLGFALENFDAIGRWRTKDVLGKPLDTSGTLPTGEKVASPAELKKVLLTRKNEVMANLCAKMLSYSLGRGTEIFDRPTLKDIQVALEKNSYKSQTLIIEIVKSYPFRYKQNLSLEAVKQ